MTREPPLNWVGVTFASSAPEAVSKTSLATLSPSCTNDAPMIGEQRRDEVERAVRRGDQDAQDDRHDRRGQERQARGAQRQEPERQPRADRRPALGRERVEVLARLPDRALRVLEERDLALVPAPGAVRGQRDAAVERGRAAPHRHVPALVVAVARLRADVRAGQRDVAVGRHGQAGRPGEPGDQLGRADARVDGDADRIAVVVDPRRDLIREGGQLVEPGPGIETVGAAHHAASPAATSVSCRRGRGVPVRPVEDAPRRDLDQRPLEEERQRDPHLEERDDRRLLDLPDGQEALPLPMRVRVDDAGVALDQRSVVPATDRDRVGDRDRHLRRCR